MNRLIIIGNGFDLAHGLPTSYRDFIDDYWGNVIKKLTTNFHYSDELFEANAIVLQFNNFAKDRWEDVKNYDNIFSFLNSYDEANFLFKNELFRLISNQKYFNNWVDIENEYYKLLKDCLNRRKSIIDLNREFEKVKSLLEKYLIDKIENKFEINSDITKNILSLFETKTFTGEELNEFYKEISKKGEKVIEDEYQNFLQRSTGYKSPNQKNPKLKVSNTFLSFNYTSTMKSYLNLLNIESEHLNEIHGSIIDETNPINFGFGDEMDEDYKKIEDKNDNEYLKNIKSFQYLHTQNYKQLLNIINADLFQVYIMGHSCGLSDRTLLNTIFEHENCCSIKIFYHQKEDGTDNYTEITQNISRHFNDKKLMREKIVNKTLCQPLPQIKLPKKE